MSQIVVTPDGKRHVFPDEANLGQIKAALASYAQPTQPMEPLRYPPRFGPGPVGPTPAELAPLRARAASALGVLPTAGGMAGGIGGAAVGGLPGAIGGAALGGAAGEAARQGLVGQPLSVGGIAGQGAQQGAYEALGGIIGAGAGRLARPLMRRALGAGKAIIRDFPDVAETAVAKGIPVTRAGVAKATGLRQASGQALTSLLNQAGAGGTTFYVGDMTRNAAELLRSKVLPNSDKARIAAQVMSFLEQHGLAKRLPGGGLWIQSPNISPVLAKQLKQFYQSRASAIFRAEKTGALTLAQQNRGLFSREVAGSAKQLLERIPGVAEREAETQSLIGAQRAVSEAFMRPPPRFQVIRPETWPGLSTLNSPGAVSHYALVLSSPYFRALSRQSPRAAAALLFQLGAQDSTGAPP